MKKLLMSGVTALALAAGAASAQAEDIKVGVILGFTGPIESLTPDMAGGAEMALSEASESGKLLGGSTVSSVRADSTCVDAAAATSAAERLITSDKVAAIMGADCSGVTMAVANNVAVSNGVVMISPSATSPALTSIDDKGYFFRTAPSDARQGEVLADIAISRGLKSVAVTYTNNDYGKGLDEAFRAAFEAAGGKVEISAAHEDGKADYSAEVGALAAAGAEALMVFGYVDQGGKGIIEASLDAGAFDTFIGSDGMIGESLIDALGSDLEGFVTSEPSSKTDGMGVFVESANAAGIKGDGPFVAQSYDAAALIVLAMQAAGSADRAAIQANILNVANAPGEKINPGELGKALEILANGGQVDYQGATGVELTDIGETPGVYKEQEVKDGAYETIKFH
ncbi:ABC transporter substrate-binding protein [Curvivirga aplysinae]|uniref:ABC transporter substrate-binding protein n=1 Tax=Curvivirga aplysinae TaxID=2529852 RepID=UPI0012BCB364|nr:ABC transporter substrate-binding protein [Curvivirga aplysinae]MTI10668.1 branched-chain amino acid ABC transporter substrate-binding protein [Curvivirga aplysinae]